MPVGAGELHAGLSYVAVGRELTLGTGVTCTAALDVISSSLGVKKERKTLEQIERSRTMSKGISLSQYVQGDMEFYFAPEVDACGFMLQNAMGGAITSATATGETVGAGANSAMTHTFNLGSMDGSYPSMSVNIRKGPSTGGKVFQYHGVRVNEISFSAEIDDALKCSVGLVGVDATTGVASVESFLTVTAAEVLSFVSGRLSVEANANSLTSSSFWHIQSAEFGWSNSVKDGPEARRIGSAIPVVLPVGMATFNMKCKIRFDTTTAWSAMINATQLAIELEFLGSTFTSSAIRRGLKIQFPKVFVNDAGDPEIGGPDEVLMSDVDFQILRDDSTSTGFAVKALLTNQKASYT